MVDIGIGGNREAEMCLIVTPKMVIYDLAAVRADGSQEIGERVAARLARTPGRFWLHLDVDVIAGELLPAVDYIMEDGLTWEEATALLRPLATSPGLLGADCTIYNPKLDRTGQYALRITQLLADVFGAS